MRLWGGRFYGELDSRAVEFTTSLPFDKRLYPYDIAVSKAHASALAECGVLSGDELDRVLLALDDIQAEMEKGTFSFLDDDEDIHTAVERALVEKVGEAGQKLRAGRSRNDQVAADMRLYLKKESAVICQQVLDVAEVLLEKAEENLGALMPGFTHLQPAQPVLLSHHLLAYVEMLRRDLSRFHDGYRRMDASPLGSGALAGVTFPLKREAIADELGFSNITTNSIDAVSDRDFVVEFSFDLAMTAVHLSQLCEEVVIWSNPFFEFVTLDDSFATGSSIMPQKKNPDVAELLRGKTSSAIAVLVKMLTLLKGLPLAYNRDLQEDKEALFCLIDETKKGLRALEGMLSTLTFNTANMEKRTREGFLNATDLADYLVGKGVPFLQAHQVAGKAVMLCQKKDIQLEELSLEELKEIHPAIDEDVYERITIQAAIEARNLPGGTSLQNVRNSLDSLKDWLKEEREVWREALLGGKR